MTPCQVQERAAVHSARDTLVDCFEVVCVDALSPARSVTDRWCLLILLDRTAGGIPPTIGSILADRGLTVRRSNPAGNCWRVLATA